MKFVGNREETAKLMQVHELIISEICIIYRQLRPLRGHPKQGSNQAIPGVKS
jgi:hypothetical protein